MSSVTDNEVEPKAPKLPFRKSFFTAVCQKIVASIRSKGLFQFLLIAIGVGVVQTSAFMIPALQWLPSQHEANAFLKTLWQVHASILGVTVIVVTIIITVIANEKDRTRTWKLYSDKTKFVPVIWFNLLAIASEGLALLQTSQATNPLFFSDKVGNLILSEGILLIISIVIAIMLFTVTVRFLDDDYIEDLAEKRIVRAMPAAVEDNIKHIQEFISKLRNKTNGN
jgi:magnesium-transporting ATPase (P-type)